MRVVVNALGAHRGGLATYVRNIVATWPLVAPDDDLTVLATEPFATEIGSRLAQAGYLRITCAPRRPAQAWRLMREQLLVPRQQRHADALLATLPVVPFAWRAPAVAIVYDLLHEDRPHDMSRMTRLGRTRLYSSAFRRADRLLTVSNRTAAALIRRHPATAPRVRVAALGADHVPAGTSPRSGGALAFGHFRAKDPELLLHAWRLLRSRSSGFAETLHVVGLSDPTRQRLLRRAHDLELDGCVVLHPYMPQDRFDNLFRCASAVLFPSRYEGFGLPVLEAMRHGVPVMISPDPALVEVAGGHASCSASWAPDDVAAAIRQAFATSDAQVSAAGSYAGRFTWARTVAETRAALEEASAARSSPR